MNKNDIGRMVSLADERYVDEMLEERITLNGRKRNGFTGFAAMAAAAAVVIGGIWCFASTAGNIDEPLTPIPAEQSRVADNLGAQPFDYASLFKNKLDEEPTDILKEDIVIHSIFAPDDGYATSSKEVIFGDEYTKAVMPFDAEYFNYCETEFYYDGEDSVKFIVVRLGKNLNDNRDKMCRITVCKEGELLAKMNLDGYAFTERLGAEVCGFELNWRSDSNKVAVFAANGFEYEVESVSNMTYDELGVIIDALIEKGISASDFDVLMGQLTEGHYGRQLTLAEANATAPFAGYIPQSTHIGNMELDGVSYGESSRNSIVDYKYIGVSYICEEPYNFIYLSYGTYREDPLTSVPLDDILYKLDGFAEPTGTNGVFNYTFAVECGEFWIKVWANCTPKEMEQCLNEISGTAAYDEDYEERIAEEMRRLEEEKEEQKRLEEEKEKQRRLEEEQQRINEQFERIKKGGDEALTLEKVKKLAQKGDKLDWSDFENFSGTEVGSGLFIMAYSVEDTDYWVHVGGVPGEKPWYVYLSEDWNEQRIDIRYDSIDEFLS